jgi:hypothetical protein
VSSRVVHFEIGCRDPAKAAAYYDGCLWLDPQGASARPQKYTLPHHDAISEVL